MQLKSKQITKVLIASSLFSNVRSASLYQKFLMKSLLSNNQRQISTTQNKDPLLRSRRIETPTFDSDIPPQRASEDLSQEKHILQELYNNYLEKAPDAEPQPTFLHYDDSESQPSSQHSSSPKEPELPLSTGFLAILKDEVFAEHRHMEVDDILREVGKNIQLIDPNEEQPGLLPALRGVRGSTPVPIPDGPDSLEIFATVKLLEEIDLDKEELYQLLMLSNNGKLPAHQVLPTIWLKIVDAVKQLKDEHNEEMELLELDETELSARSGKINELEKIVDTLKKHNHHLKTHQKEFQANQTEIIEENEILVHKLDELESKIEKLELLEDQESNSSMEPSVGQPLTTERDLQHSQISQAESATTENPDLEENELEITQLNQINFTTPENVLEIEADQQILSEPITTPAQSSQHRFGKGNKNNGNYGDDDYPYAYTEYEYYYEDYPYDYNYLDENYEDIFARYGVNSWEEWKELLNSPNAPTDLELLNLSPKFTNDDNEHAMSQPNLLEGEVTSRAFMGPWLASEDPKAVDVASDPLNDHAVTFAPADLPVENVSNDNIGSNEETVMGPESTSKTPVAEFEVDENTVNESDSEVEEPETSSILNNLELFHVNDFELEELPFMDENSDYEFSNMALRRGDFGGLLDIPNFDYGANQYISGDYDLGDDDTLTESILGNYLKFGDFNPETWKALKSGDLSALGPNFSFDDIEELKQNSQLPEAINSQERESPILSWEMEPVELLPNPSIEAISVFPEAVSAATSPDSQVTASVKEADEELVVLSEQLTTIETVTDTPVVAENDHSTPQTLTEPLAEIIIISSHQAEEAARNSNRDQELASIRSQIKKQAAKLSPNEQERLDKLERARLHAELKKSVNEKSMLEDILRFVMLVQSGWSDWTAYIAVKVF